MKQLLIYHIVFFFSFAATVTKQQNLTRETH